MAMTGAEKTRAFMARKADVGEIPPVRHPRLKAKCATDLESFGWYYCRQVLKHRASKDVKNGLIKDIQNCILGGGKTVKMYGRGTGKTTWVNDIGIVWAILYGHRRFPVTIAATGRQGVKNLKRIKYIIERSDGILADFPAIAVPIRALAGVTQRAHAQTYRGEPTDVEWATDQLKLPMLRDEDGNPIERGCGAVVAAAGIGGAIRGANEGGQRPDFLVLDDPQTKKSAHSPKMVQDIIDYIHQDALFLAGHDRAMSAMVTITPQCYGDVAMELTSQSKHPEWAVSVEPFVKSTCKDFDRLADAFKAEYVEDMANHDYRMTRSRAWYVSHKDDFAGTAVLDGEQFDHELEVDAIHHILNLRASLGEAAYNAEIMMRVSDVGGELAINPDLVANALNGYPRGVAPPCIDSAVAFCDVNTHAGAGLSWAVVGFGRGRTAAVIDYGRYPERGDLVEENASDAKCAKAIASAIHQVVARIADMKIYRSIGSKKIEVQIRALAFDRGYKPDVIHRALAVIRKAGYYPHGASINDDGTPAKLVHVPFNLVAQRGFPWNKYGTRRSDMLRRGDHCFATRSQYGEYIAEMSPYWREIMQRSWNESPLLPGSLSLFGSSATAHYAFAQEICAWKMLRKYVHPSGVLAWDWVCNGSEHWCDAVKGCFATASWFRLYDATSSTVDHAALLAKDPSEDDEGTGVVVESAAPADNPRQFNFAKAKPAQSVARHKLINRPRGRYCK